MPPLAKIDEIDESWEATRANDDGKTCSLINRHPFMLADATNLSFCLRESEVIFERLMINERLPFGYR